MSDQISQNNQGNTGGGHGNHEKGGNTPGGRINTSAWLIGALLVLLAVFAGLRFTRVPAPETPAPTRPAPTVPAPTPTPSPTTPIPTDADLDRSITRVEDSIERKDWDAAEREFSMLRSTWESLRSRITGEDATKNVSAFETSMRNLEKNIRDKNEEGAKDDIRELKTTADKFDLTRPGGPTTG
ncbi:MAG: hypothetical protein GX969_05880 [Firmicutes bacterium]|mgnify:CR=1 FL=1|nr:hypothetical protein [Bacillota bacterium]